LLPSGPLAEQARLGGSGEVLGTAFSLWADYPFAPLPGSPSSTVGTMTPVIGPARETVAAIQAERYDRALFYGGSAIVDVVLAKWLANGVVSVGRRVAGSHLVTSGGRWRWGYNAIPDTEAAAAYQAIRESTTDVAASARYTGYKPDRIRRIKDYLFNNPEWTAADAEIAAAWHRLRTGRGTNLDRLLLKHETAEMFLRQRYGLDYWEAHRRANQQVELRTGHYGARSMKSYPMSDVLQSAIESLFDDPSVAYGALGVDRAEPDEWDEDSCCAATDPIERARLLLRTLENYIVQMAEEHEELGSPEASDTLRMQAVGILVALRELVRHFPELKG